MRVLFIVLAIVLCFLAAFLEPRASRTRWTWLPHLGWMGVGFLAASFYGP